MGTHPIFESDFDCLTERNDKTIDEEKIDEMERENNPPVEEDENVEQSEDSNEKTVGFEDDWVTVNPSDVAGTETNEEKKDSDADNEDVEGEPEDEPEEEIIVNVPDVSDQEQKSKSLPEGGLFRFHDSFGYDSHHRSNLHIFPDQKALFSAGNLLIFRNLDPKVKENKETIIRSPSGTVGAIAIHPSYEFFAVAGKGIGSRTSKISTFSKASYWLK